MYYCEFNNVTQTIFMLKLENYSNLCLDNFIDETIIISVFSFFCYVEKLPEMLALTELEGEKLSIVYLYCNGLLK